MGFVKLTQVEGVVCVVCVNEAHDILPKVCTIHYKSNVVIPKLGQGLAKVEAQLRPVYAEETLKFVYVAHVKLPIVDVIQVFLSKAGLLQHLLQVHVVGLGHILVVVGRLLVYGCIRAGEHGLEGIYVVAQVGFVVEDVVLAGVFLALLTLAHDVFVDVLMFTYDKIQPGHDDALINHANIKDAGNPLVEPGVIKGQSADDDHEEPNRTKDDAEKNEENEGKLNVGEEKDEKKGKDAVQVKAA